MCKVTVFTSCYNHAEFLPQAIESVLNQTYGDFEYLLVDDGSMDDSWEVMKDFESMDSRIKAFRLEKQPNKGPVLNFGIQNSRGDYWVWVPADDAIDETLLEEKLRFSRRHPNAVIYDSFRVVDENNQEKCVRQVPITTPEDFAKIVWKKAPIGFTGIWIPMEILKRIPFPDHVRYSEDYYWLLNAVKHGVEFRGMRKVLHTKRDHPNSETRRNYEAVMKDVENIRKELR